MFTRATIIVLCCFASPAFAQSDWVGNYASRHGPYSLSAKISPNAGGTFKVKVEVASQRPSCMGEVETTAEMKGSELVTQPAEKGDECRLTISKSGTGITLKEDKCSTWHGAACEFSGSLKRR